MIWVSRLSQAHEIVRPFFLPWQRNLYINRIGTQFEFWTFFCFWFFVFWAFGFEVGALQVHQVGNYDMKQLYLNISFKFDFRCLFLFCICWSLVFVKTNLNFGHVYDLTVLGGRQVGIGFEELIQRWIVVLNRRNLRLDVLADRWQKDGRFFTICVFSKGHERELEVLTCCQDGDGRMAGLAYSLFLLSHLLAKRIALHIYFRRFFDFKYF